MKKIIAVLLICIFTFGMSSIAFAEEDMEKDTNDYSHELIGLDGEPSRERWSYTSTLSQSVYIDSNATLIGTATLTGHSDVTKIVCYMYPQQWVNGGWKNLATYCDTEYYSSFLAEHYVYNVPKGYTYRIRCSFYVYVGDKYEHIIAFSSNKSY